MLGSCIHLATERANNGGNILLINKILSCRLEFVFASRIFNRFSAHLHESGLYNLIGQLSEKPLEISPEATVFSLLSDKLTGKSI